MYVYKHGWLSVTAVTMKKAHWTLLLQINPISQSMTRFNKSIGTYTTFSIQWHIEEYLALYDYSFK